MAIFVILISSVAVPSGSFTTGTMERDSTVDVVDDPNAIIGLEKYSQLDIGDVDDLVTVTNNVNPDLESTLTLNSTHNNQVLLTDTNGKSTTFTLSSSNSKTVSVDLESDCDLDGKTLSYTLDGNTTTFDGTMERSAVMKAPNAFRQHVVYQDDNTSDLRMINRSGTTGSESGTITKFNVTTQGFSPVSVDFDCDGRMEASYIDSNGNITIIDATEEQQQLLTGDARKDARLGTADIDRDGKPAVLYSNVSDNGTLYRVENEELPVKIANIQVHSVTRPTDINNDSNNDIVFTDPNGNLKYYQIFEESVNDTGYDPGCKICIGDPAGFRSGKGVEIPVTDSQSRIELVKSDGSDYTVSPQEKARGSLATFDWDDDGTIDWIWGSVDKGLMKYKSDSTGTLKIKNRNGDVVRTDNKGAA